MRIEFTDTRIYLIIENREDGDRIRKIIPNASEVFAFFTYDAGKNGNEVALVITRHIS